MPGTASSSAASAVASRVIVMDNGGDTIKVGFGGQAKPIRLINNCAIKPKGSSQWLISDQHDKIGDLRAAMYKRPTTRGYVTDWEMETSIWTRIFGTNLLSLNPSECTLLLTAPLLCPPPIRSLTDELVFEHYGFHSYHRTSSASLALRGYQYEVQSLYGKPCALIVDMGYSFTHVVPLLQYCPVFNAIRRLNIGGKMLTAQLREQISLRQVDVRQDTAIVSDIKEKCCYVSTDFMADCKRLKANTTLQQEMTAYYMLPNGTTNMSGYVCDYAAYTQARSSSNHQSTALSLCVERMSIPELLFNPSDCGIEQMGLADVIVDSVSQTDESMYAAYLEHIILAGGSCSFPGLAERLQAEVRARVGEEYAVRVVRSKEPLTTAWCGGSCLSIDPQFGMVCVTKQEYEEQGERAGQIKFT